MAGSLFQDRVMVTNAELRDLLHGYSKLSVGAQPRIGWHLWGFRACGSDS